MSLFKSLIQIRSIQPKIEKTESLLRVRLIEPLLGDWILTACICLIGIPIAFYTTVSNTQFFFVSVFLVVLAYSLIDDTYDLVIMKPQNEVKIIKTKMGQTKWIRVSPLDELVNCEVMATVDRKTTSYRIELEFMSDFGSYRIPVNESTVVGEHNRMQLHSIATQVIDFCELKPIPEGLKEESIARKFESRKRNKDGANKKTK